MLTYTSKIRVRYAETDQMGYMYYGNYAQYYEVGRVELLRSLGMTYRSMEESGVMMPVLEMRSKYIKPARYDEEIAVKVMVDTLPEKRIVFHYELYNESQELINVGETTLVFVNRDTKKPCHAPSDFLHRIQAFFT